MTKNLLKIIALLSLFAIPKNINEGYSPKLKELEHYESIDIKEKELTNYRNRLIDINEEISFLERKKEFFLMRLQEKNNDSIIKENYLRNLNETQKELKKYFFQKDSIYKLIKK